VRFDWADPNLIDEYHRETEARIADFQKRMRLVEPTYKVGDRVELDGEIFEIVRYEREVGEPGYWLAGREDLFIPVDTESRLKPVHD
jgi:hypothetical protein